MVQPTSFMKGWTGEQRIRGVQAMALDPTEYHCFYDVLVKTNMRSTQIDHVIVSKYGVFVVETKNMAGSIYGRAEERSWTQVMGRSRQPFQNPLRQNYLHARTISRFCAIDFSKIHSVVVFCGECKLRRTLPANVVKVGDYIRYIKSKRQVLLSDAEVTDVSNRLGASAEPISIFTSLRHAEQIKTQRNRRDICPRCGGRLVVRTARRGRASGKRFIGCQNFPECRFANHLPVS